MNSVNLTGRWTKDVELRYTPSGTAVAKGTLAVERPFAKEGEQQADFIPIVIWGKMAEATAQHTGKGHMVAVENGRIQVRQYEAQDGSKRWVTEVVAGRVQFLAKPQGNGNNAPQVSPAQSDFPADDFGGFGSFNEDDLPF